MMLLDSNIPVLPSGAKAAGTLPNGCACRKASVLKSCAPVSPVRPTLAIEASASPSASGRAANFELHATKPCRNGRLPHSRIWQVGENAQPGHRNLEYRLTPREVQPPNGPLSSYDNNHIIYKRHRLFTMARNDKHSLETQRGSNG